MKTVITKTIKARIKELQFGYWDDGKEEFIPIVYASDEKEASEQLNVSEELISAMTIFVDDLKDKLLADLTDIWLRLEEIQAQIEQINE